MKKLILPIFLCVALLVTGCSKKAPSKTTDSSILYSLKTSTIGDNSAVSAIVSNLDIPEDCGEYTISLQTAETPYYLTIEFHSVWADDKIEELKQHMINQSIIALALIDNADAVAFTFNYMDGEEEMLSVITISTAMANSILKEDIRSFSESEESFAELLDILNNQQ